jgi:hypothetical protein
MTQKHRTHLFKLLKPSVEKIVNLHGIKLHLKTKKYKMYAVNVDQNGMAAYLTEANVKGFKKCCISNAVDGTDDML